MPRPPTKEFRIRAAQIGDVETIRELIAASARGLGADFYSPEQIEGALRGAWGVDTQLVRDGTYAVVERRGVLVGCGGWSWRRTLFGADAATERDPGVLDPRTEGARIRAFFVHPSHARQGIASAILEYCEREARARGFSRFELMATLPGEQLYARHGYRAGAPVQWDLGRGLSIEFVPMSKHVPE
jgi:GNAT superfamily N-acetyltransferase